VRAITWGKVKMQHFETIIYKHTIELIFDLKRGHWYALFPKHGQYASGPIGHGNFERNHNFLVIGTREYELVIDCNDDHTRWESWSVFDVKKQDYLPVSGRFE
jgi:hypothetical protein